MLRAVLLASVTLGIAAVPAEALRTRTDVVRAKVHRTGGSGTTMVYRGTVRSKLFGRGRVVERIGNDLKGTFVITYRRGKVRGRSTAWATPAGDHVEVSGTYRVTGGTRRYRHIRGHGTFKGSSSGDFTRATSRMTGRVTF